MIKEKIEVRYSIRRDNGAIAFGDYRDFLEEGESWFNLDIIDTTRTFHLFKNNGHVSKSDCSRYDAVNAEAERLLAERLNVKEHTADDIVKCKNLAKIVSDAYYDSNADTEWVTIKVKTSHSNWYQHGGELNTRSQYLTQVPAEVKKQARELQAIRRKHQNDDAFDFAATAYLSREVRVADHENED
ncbi:hypothetical protein GNF18_10120 [Ligilactobacillus pobuzihii]|uniref:hypothetical protein n=1 Tax=Ligilactobacillus pobuzihii TaxID=449659 RepID=UPI0019D0CF91|nr:hypothetical protein [Ligilactobacillus pobuzihii]MBN7275495.1 hypothetical protein [Ligilactobacillus pobuzihii]